MKLLAICLTSSATLLKTHCVVFAFRFNSFFYFLFSSEISFVVREQCTNSERPMMCSKSISDLWWYLCWNYFSKFVGTPCIWTNRIQLEQTFMTDFWFQIKQRIFHQNLPMGSQSASHCPVCLNIFIEPVVLPCEHCLCKPCFDEIVKKSNLQCPLCRKRIGSWARLQTRNGTLVNKEKWNYIQKAFPEEVKARLTGAETPKKTGKLENR